MDFSLSPEQQAIRDAIERICARFGDDYWLGKDKEGGFPHDFHRAFADDGWLGICIPQEYGGSGLGVTEAAILMQAIAESGAGMSGASALHMNIFGLNPVVVFGNDEQKRRMLPPLIAGPGQGVLRRHRAQRRAGDAQAQDQGGARRQRPLRDVGPEDLDIDRAGRDQDADPRAHHAAGAGQAPHRGAESLLYGLQPQAHRRARDPEDGAQRRRLQRAVHRQPAGADGGQDRRGGQGLRIHPARHESGAHPDRRRGGRPRPRRAAQGGQLCKRARGVRPSDRAEPGDPASAGEMLDGTGGGEPDGVQGRLALRQGRALRCRGQRDEISRRRGCVPRLRDRADDPRRHGLRQGIPRRALSCARC